MTGTTPPTGGDEAQVLAAWRALPKVEPPTSLDQRILAASRAQAAMSPASGATPAAVAAPGRRPRWPALWATAAVLTLAVGVSWQLRQQHPGVATPPAPASAPPPLLDRVDEKSAAPAAPAAAEAGRRQRDAQADAGARPAEGASELATAAGAATADGEAQAALRAQAMASNEAEAEDAAVVTSEATPMMQSAPVPQAKREAPMPQAAPPAATASALPPPAPPAPGPEDVRAREETLSTPPDIPAAPAAASAKSESDSTGPAATAIARIRELATAGRIDAAREAAARFAVDHPEARLPDDLAWLAAPR